MATKTPNYSDKDMLIVRTEYDPKANDAQRKAQLSAIAVKLKKSEQSVRMKLTSLQLYVKLATTKKEPKEKQATREQLLESLALTLDVPASDLEGLERANRASLVTLNRVISELVG